MEVILLEKVDNLGSLGERVSVKSGYARNYLVPAGKAKLATTENIARFEALREELERQAGDILVTAQTRKSALDELGAVVVTAKAGAEGKLFGSVGPREVVDALAALGVAVDKKEVRMPEGPIRAIGDYAIGLHLHSDVDARVALKVEAEK